LEFIVRYHNDYTLENINKLLLKNFLINRIIIHSSPFDKEEIINTHTVVIFTRESVDEKSTCGKINKNYFAVNLQHIAESKYHNTCLHKKMFIDKNGNIKNCPFSETVFGNILNDEVEKIITSHSFTKYWNIKKDEIDVCKDCEFRYICTDCRIFIKDRNNIYSQPVNCHYNPYIAKWKGEEGYVTVEAWVDMNKGK
jgi:SPASM domain peptide maturase of grasp-with-spasm system